jgi:redox-sensitive bicupin YhaK (pirin superfamily)
MKTGISEPREVTKIVRAHRQREGGGFIVRRPFPSAGFRHADPFLLLDEMGPVEYGPGEAIGAASHPTNSVAEWLSPVPVGHLTPALPEVPILC